MKAKNFDLEMIPWIFLAALIGFTLALFFSWVLVDVPGRNPLALSAAVIAAVYSSAGAVRLLEE